jgi:glyoxylase-like metal-dependent hydrolase (beta-lactamase superfamily II)
MHSFPSELTFFERGWLSSNNVLIQDKDQAILVDSGYWTHAEQTHALIKPALGNSKLTTLINTHLHSDHCGGNAHLQMMYPGLETLIPSGHAAFVDHWDPITLTYAPTGQHCPPFKKTRALQNGDTFIVAGKTWRIHAAAGHDPHSIILFNEVDGILISADALWENGFGVVFPEIEGIEAFDEVEATLNLIEQLKPQLVLPGHGSAFTNVSEAIVRAKSRLAQFRAAPDKHAAYAAKVLLKFKLLEFQEIKQSNFLSWGASTEYLQLLHERYANQQSFEAWFLTLCKSLEKSNACILADGNIINTN